MVNTKKDDFLNDLTKEFEKFRKEKANFPPDFLDKNNLWQCLLGETRKVADLEKNNKLLLEKIKQVRSLSVNLEREIETILEKMNLQVGMGTDDVYFSHEVCELLTPIQRSMGALNERLQSISLERKDTAVGIDAGEVPWALMS
jgi:hypothetical protein